jgi:hypothetical protein
MLRNVRAATIHDERSSKRLGLARSNAERIKGNFGLCSRFSSFDVSFVASSDR